MVEELGPGVKRQLVCGLHVHVGMESFDRLPRGRSRRSRRGCRPCWRSPSTRRTSAGVETDGLSARAERLLELPRGGPPPAMATEQEWEERIEATGEDYTRSWWDARPHPRLGTLEVRIPDQPTSVERAAALAALVQALCARPPDEQPAGDYLSQRAAAAAGSASGERLLALVEPAARELGTWELVDSLRGPPEALRQLEVGRREGLAAVAADLVGRTAA